jgi:preprotein translocase subunit SecD
LDAPGGQKFSQGTAKAIGDSLAIIINNELVHVAGVYAQIMAPVTAITRKGLTKSQADKYSADIRAKMKK